MTLQMMIQIISFRKTLGDALSLRYWIKLRLGWVVLPNRWWQCFSSNDLFFQLIELFPIVAAQWIWWRSFQLSGHAFINIHLSREGRLDFGLTAARSYNDDLLLVEHHGAKTGHGRLNKIWYFRSWISLGPVRFTGNDYQEKFQPGLIVNLYKLLLPGMISGNINL